MCPVAWHVHSQQQPFAAGATGEPLCVAEVAANCPVPQQCRKLLQQLLVLLSNGDLEVHFSLRWGAGAARLPKKMHLSDCKDGRLLQAGAESGTGACFSSTFDKYSIAWESSVISLSPLSFLKMRGGIFHVSTTRKHCNRFFYYYLPLEIIIIL